MIKRDKNVSHENSCIKWCIRVNFELLAYLRIDCQNTKCLERVVRASYESIREDSQLLWWFRLAVLVLFTALGIAFEGFNHLPFLVSHSLSVSSFLVLSRPDWVRLTEAFQEVLLVITFLFFGCFERSITSTSWWLFFVWFLKFSRNGSTPFILFSPCLFPRSLSSSILPFFSSLSVVFVVFLWTGLNFRPLNLFVRFLIQWRNTLACHQLGNLWNKWLYLWNIQLGYLKICGHCWEGLLLWLRLLLDDLWNNLCIPNRLSDWWCQWLLKWWL